MKRFSVALTTLAVVAGLLGAAPALAANRPDTTITAGPSGTTAPGPATFRFRSSPKGAGFECRLDGRGWKRCTSPKTYRGLPDAQHAFKVRAVSHGRVDKTPAVRHFEVVTPITLSQEFADAAAAFYLPDAGTFDVPASCSGNPTIDCPGGVPSPSAEQVSLTSSRTVDPVDGVDRYDVTAVVAVQTLTPVIVDLTSPAPASCTLTVTSGNGSTDAWTVHSGLDFVTDPESGEMTIQPVDFSVDGLEDADVQIAGDDVACAFAGSFMPAIKASLVDALGDMLASQTLCAARGPELVALCAAD